jgi:twinkle protein
MSWSDLGIDTRGHSHGQIKTTCPQCSHTRKKKNYPCLNVNIDDGVYNCWHCGWSGKIKELTPVMRRNIVQVKEKVLPTFKPQLLDEEALKFLAGRGITPEVAARNQLSLAMKYMPQREAEVKCLAFPFINNGKVVNVKYRDKHKYFTQESGAERAFYKYDDIDPKCTIITEGEFDALALEVAGFRHAISVPDGAPTSTSKNLTQKFAFLDVEDERIDAVEKFILAIDADAPGRKLEEELARRLGKERCYTVRWPEGCKDANDVLVEHGAEVLAKVIEEAQPYPVDGIFELNDMAIDLDEIYEKGLPAGLTTGWTNVDEFYRPMEGQWTLVTGVPGMGKSEWLDALMMNMSRQHFWVTGVCSPENQPITFHASKLMEKYAGKRLHKMTREEYNEAKEWVNTFFKFILPEDRTLESLLAKAKLLVKRYGMKGLIIDPYNEITHTHRKEGISETEYISEFLAQLRGFCRSMGVHIFLVAHPTKLQKGVDGKYPVPTGYDVAGSAHFFNKADNIIAVHRDKSNPHAPSEIHIQKIRSRWLGQLGTTNLTWDKHSGQYSTPLNYVGDFMR